MNPLFSDVHFKIRMEMSKLERIDAETIIYTNLKRCTISK